jgi:hypothetical protein
MAVARDMLPWIPSPDRLGVEAHELPGVHSPFLTRPAELADLIIDLMRGLRLNERLLDFSTVLYRT